LTNELITCVDYVGLQRFENKRHSVCFQYGSRVGLSRAVDRKAISGCINSKMAAGGHYHYQHFKWPNLCKWSANPLHVQGDPKKVKPQY